MPGRRLLIAVFLVPAAASADGGAPGSFLRQDISGRAAGLSGAFGAIADDASAVFWNPAGLGRLAKPELAATHVILQEDTGVDLGIGAVPLRRGGGLALGYLRQSSGGFERRSSPLEPPTAFSITQTALFAGWGRVIAGLPIPVRAGASLKLARETIDTAAASAWGADVGLGADPHPRLQLGLLIHNALAPRLTFQSAPQRYPRAVDVTGATAWGDPRGLHALAILRMAATEGEGKLLSGGIELSHERLTALRLGADGRGWSTGAGMRLGNFHIDYAALFRDLGIAHQVTLRVQFGSTREELAELIRRGIQRFTRDEALRLARAYAQSAARYQEEGNHPRAISDLEAAALWAPEDAEIARKLREVTARVEDAARRQIVERTSLLAEQQFKRGNWVASQTHWRSVLDFDADNQRARGALTLIERALAGRSEAEAAEREERDKRLRRARQEALALVAAGDAALREGRYREAAAQAVAAFKAMPGLAEADGLRARAERERLSAVGRLIKDGERLFAAKEFAKAAASFEAALSQDPDNQRAREGLSNCRSALRVPLGAEARKQIEKTYFLAVDAYLKGRYQDARRQLDAIFKLDASDENGRKLLEKVEAALRLGPR